MNMINSCHGYFGINRPAKLIKLNDNEWLTQYFTSNEASVGYIGKVFKKNAIRYIGRGTKQLVLETQSGNESSILFNEIIYGGNKDFYIELGKLKTCKIFKYKSYSW